MATIGEMNAMEHNEPSDLLIALKDGLALVAWISMTVGIPALLYAIQRGV